MSKKDKKIKRLTERLNRCMDEKRTLIERPNSEAATIIKSAWHLGCVMEEAFWFGNTTKNI